MIFKRNREASVCGIHIGAHEVRMAKLEKAADGSQRLILDLARGSEPQEPGLQWISEAIDQLTTRHQLKRTQLAVTLDGDFCVTRVTTGTPEEVDHGLRMLAARVPRYLSLGPGEKITGGYRTELNKKRDYAVTGVANRRVVEGLQQIFSQHDLSPRSLEPTLVAVARSLGQMPGMEAPVLLVDGTGTQWDVGIAHEGRLLLDYRPSGALESDRFSSILGGHMARLHRFCERHRQIAQSELRDLYIYGPWAKVAGAQQSFEGQTAIRVRPLVPADVLRGVSLPAEASETCWVGAVAAALTYSVEAEPAQVADLLASAHRERSRSKLADCLWTLAPLGVAASLLTGMFGVVQQQRSRAPAVLDQQLSLEDRTARIREEMHTNGELRSRLDALRSIEQSVAGADPSLLLIERIPRALPDTAKLNRVVLSDCKSVRLTGTTMNESIVYDVISGLRSIPGVHSVVLQATAPTARLDSEETDFAILVTVDGPASPNEA